MTPVGTVPYLVGATLSLAVSGLSSVVGFDRDRAFYPTVLIVIAWLVVAALAAHGLLDVFHDRIIANPGVPAWWPAFCLAYDGVAAGYLAFLLYRRVVRVRAA